MTEAERIKDFKDLLSYQISRKLPQSHDINWDQFTEWLIENGFFNAPASTKYHGSYPGGLYDHSRAVFKRLEKLTEDNGLTWQQEESPFIVGMFHDLCKIDQYTPIIKTDYVRENSQLVSNDEITGYEYNTHTILKGHGSKSVILLSQFINLTEEEMLCIRYHMAAYEKEEWAEFDMAVRRYENVLWTHQADQLASKIDNL